MSNIRKKYFGDKAFYKMVLTIAMPVIFQNLITNFVSLLDNIMVGSLGTEQMSGVAIGNQLLFIFNLCIFGGYSGAGIFTAQFFGKQDNDGIRYTMRFKAILGFIVTTVAITVFAVFGRQLIDLFLHDGSQTGNLLLTQEAGVSYLNVMLIGLIPFAVTQVYSMSLREVGETLMPMIAGIIAVLTNLFFNWVFIFGNLGFTAMGVRGAAIATVISRVVECVIVVTWAHRHPYRFPFIKKLWRSLRIPADLTGQIIRRGLPLLFNEALWSLSMTMINQCYSLRGLAVVAAVNIASTIQNLFAVLYTSIGSSVGIVVGKLLGSGDTEEAVDTNRKMAVFSVMFSTVVGAVMVSLSGLFPQLYNTTEEVRELAAYMICICGIFAPMTAYINASYFALRCGGKTVITFLFDCGFSCVIDWPLAFVLANFTGLNIRYLYLACQVSNLIKLAIGYVLIKKRVWVNNIVGGEMR